MILWILTVYIQYTFIDKSVQWGIDARDERGVSIGGGA